MQYQEFNTKIQKLISETRKGNEESYNQFLQIIAKITKTKAYFILNKYKKNDLTEDITQEVLITIHLKLQSYNQNIPFRKWINAIIKNKIIDMLRKNKIITESLDEKSENKNILTQNTTEDYNKYNAKNDLETLLEKLKPPAGKIIYELKIEGTTIKELALKHKISENNVKIIVHRGLKKLADLIAVNE